MTNYQRLEVLVNKYDSVQLGQDDNKPELFDVFTPDAFLPAPISDFIICHFHTRSISRQQIKFIVKVKN
jgi:hypothetical protein